MSSKFEICNSVVLLVALAVIVVVGGAAVEATDTKLVSSACNKQKIARDSPFYKNLAAVLADLKQNTAYSGYDYKTSRAGSRGAPTAYGRGICKKSDSQSGCNACLSNVANRIYGICGNAIGARVQLTDCYLQYEQHNF